MASKRFFPLDKISLSKEEKDLAALEIVKLHQLVLTENKDENFSTRLNQADAIKEETIRSSGGLCMAAMKKMVTFAKERGLYIDDRITALVRNSVTTASIEELPVETDTASDRIHYYPKVSKRNRLEIGQR